MKANKKKIIILVSLVVLLVATACLNYFLNVPSGSETDTPTDPVSATPTFFTSYRTDRETTRAEEILYLDGIISSTSSDEATITSAQAKKLSLCDNMERELVLEGLIKAKGYDDCVVTISTDNVNIVVMSDELSLEEAAGILNVVVSETEYEAADVVIIPYT